VSSTGIGGKTARGASTLIVQAGTRRCGHGQRPEPRPQPRSRRIVRLVRARAAAEGGIIRRWIRDVVGPVGRDRVLAQLRRRWGRVARNADLHLIFSNREPVVLLD